jgi:hypothetical protein
VIAPLEAERDDFRRPRRIFKGMRRCFTGIALLAIAGGLTGCGHGSAKAASDCFQVWNDPSNKAGQATVAGRFSIANVSEWRATAEGSANLGGPEAQGCGYLFHTSKRYLSISGVRERKTIRWGIPPSIHGSWSAQQEAAVDNNAGVDRDGLLSRRH